MPNVENIYYKNQNLIEILNNPTIYKFNDEFFPPEITSLIPNNSNDPSFEKTPKKYIEEYETYIWLRFSDIYREINYQIFQANLDQEDITQGSLGSCYLLCALIGLCAYEERVKRLFVTQEINSKGVYGVKLLIQGEYKIITVDDYVPCKPIERTPAFSTSKNREVYLMLIEKVWAKVNNSCYMRTWLGTPLEALTTLTEAPCVYENINKFIKSGKENRLWENIVSALRKKWILCLITEEIVNEEELGLVTFHAYSILKVYEIPNQNIRLLKIRNPWGNKEWRGDYSAKSAKWTYELKQEIGLNELNVQKGTFFISYEDFLKYFSWTFFCKYEDSFRYCYSKFVINKNITEISIDRNGVNYSKPARKSLNGNFINTLNNFINLDDFLSAFIEVPKKTKCYICMHQPQKRFMNYQDYDNLVNIEAMAKNKNDQKISLIPIGLIILTKYENKTHKLISSDFINWEKIYIDVTLSPGEYHIFCKSFMKYETTLELVLSTYAEYPLEIYKLPASDIDKSWLQQILITAAKNYRKKEYFHEKETSSYASNILFDTINIGHGIFYYENNSKKDTLNVRIYFDEMEGINILNLDISNIYELIIPPMEYRAIYIEITNVIWLCSVKWHHILWYDYPVEIIVSYSKNKEMEEVEKDLIVYLIKYEAGYVIMTENNSDFKYHGIFQFENSELNFLMGEKEIDFIIESKAKHYVKLKHNDLRKDTKLEYSRIFRKL